MRKGQVQARDWGLRVLEGVEPQEVEDHAEDCQLTDTVEDVEVLQNLQVGYQNDWEIENLTVEPEVEISAILEASNALSDVADKHEDKSLESSLRKPLPKYEVAK